MSPAGAARGGGVLIALHRRLRRTAALFACTLLLAALPLRLAWPVALDAASAAASEGERGNALLAARGQAALAAVKPAAEKKSEPADGARVPSGLAIGRVAPDAHPAPCRTATLEPAAPAHLRPDPTGPPSS